MNIFKKILRNWKRVLIPTALIISLSSGLFPEEDMDLFTSDLIKDAGISRQKNTLIRISLNDAIKRSLEKNPDLIAFRWKILSKDALVLQSKLLPNPELGFEVENFAGSGVNRGFENSESTFNISQKILTANKKKKRTNSALFTKKVTENTFFSVASDIILETEKRFFKTLYIQEKLKLREEMLRLSNRFLSQITIRIKAGRTAVSELSRAKISLMRNSIILKKLKKELSASKRLLSSLWGETNYNDFEVIGHMDIESGLPNLKRLEKSIEKNPEVLTLLSRIELNKNTLKLAKSLRIPDLVIEGGVRRLNETRNSAFTFSLSLPIPLFDRNQGNVRSALFRLNGLLDNLKALKITLLNRINALHERMKNLYSNALSYKSTILPETKKVFKIISRGYTMGKFDFLNMIDALRTQLEVQEDYLQTLYDYHKLNSEIKRLTGLTEKQVKKIKLGENHDKK